MPQSFEQMLRCDALTFVQQAHLELHGKPLGNDKYLELLAYDVEDIVLGDTRHYVCNLPPGFAKTSTFSVAMPAWILGHNPSARILIIAYGEELALDISGKIRAILRALWFRRAFPKASLAKGHQAVRDFETEAGGCVYARSIDGGATGIRCEHLFIDDPIKMSDSGNLARLARVNETFDGELKSRLNNPMTGTIVIVHQRLNRGDLTGHVLKQRGLRFKHRCLALVATHDHKYQLKHGTWLRKEGDILRASAYTPEYIADLRENTGAPGFGPIYQQTFEGPDVLQVRREDFVIESFYAPPVASYLLSVDLNHKGVDGQSFSVIQCWAILADRRYLLYDQWRGRAHKSLLAAEILRMKSRYHPRVILIEDNGPALDLQAQFDRPRCPVILIQPRGDKFSRLRRHLNLFRGRRVALRAGAPFNNGVIAEFEQFPHGIHDDQVDTATQVFDWAESNDLPPVPPRFLQSMGALGNPRKAREDLYWNAGRPSGPYVFSRR